MTNIYYTSDLYVQDIKKHLNSRTGPDYTSPDQNILFWAGVQRPRPAYRAAGSAYIGAGRD
jgi:hypothetical protein